MKELVLENYWNTFGSFTNLGVEKDFDNDEPINFGTNLRNGEYKEIDEDSLLRVWSYGGPENALSNLYRMSARALVIMVNELTGLCNRSNESNSSRNFVNGGTYASGAFVQESIIYVPYDYVSPYSKDVDDAQKIFTFTSAFYDYKADTHWLSPKVDFNGTTETIKGMMMREDWKPKFSNALGHLAIHAEEKWSVHSTINDLFSHHLDEPLTTDREVSMVYCNASKWLNYIHTIALLTHYHYFDNMSYTDYKNKIRLKMGVPVKGVENEEV